MAVVVSEEDAAAVTAKLTEAGETVYRIGHIARRGADEAPCVVG
jgi:phosphoribosylaminoimidazole (AIR) synthetase